MFVVRGFNDIDHFTPLLDSLCNKGNYNIHLFTSNIAILNEENENLQYLQNEYGLSLNYLLQDIKLSIWGAVLKKIYLLIYTKTLTLILEEKLRWILDRIISVLQRLLSKQEIRVGPEWAKKLVEEHNPDVIVFDMTYPEIFPNKPLVEIAKSKAIPIVALPHGIHVWTNTDHSNRDNKQRSVKYDEFDYGISQGSLATTHLKAEGWPDEKIVEIGCMRFSREWLLKYNEIFTTSNEFF